MECQFLGEKIKGQGHRRSKNTENWCCAYLRAADQVQAGQVPTQTMPTVGPTPLLGLIYCHCPRCSAAGRMATYHVSTRWRHTFF